MDKNRYYIEDDQDPSMLKQAGQFALGLGTRALQGASDLAELPARISQSSSQVSNKILRDLAVRAAGTENINENIFQPSKNALAPVSDKIENFVKEKFGENSIEPENFVSRAAQNIARSAPFLAIGGLANLPTAIAQSVPGALGYSIAENFTDNPFLKIGASVLASSGFNKVSNILKQSLSKNAGINQESILQAAKRDYYSDSEKLGGFKTPITSRQADSMFDEILEKVKDKAHTRAWGKEDMNQAIRNISKLKNKFNTPNVTGSQILEANKYANSFYDGSNPFYRDVKKVMGSFIEKGSEINPEWGSAFKTANQIHSLQNWESGLSSVLKAWAPTNKVGKIVTNPWAQAVLAGITGGIKGPVYGALAATPLASKAFDKIVQGGMAGKLLYDISSTPKGQKIIWDIVAQSAKGSSTGLAQELKNLNNYVNLKQKQNPDLFVVENESLPDFNDTSRFVVE